MTDRLTVKQLIELLEKEDASRIIYTEGCDCAGPAEGIWIGTEDSLTITRQRDGYGVPMVGNSG